MTETDIAPAVALTEAYAEWKKNVQAELNGVPFEKRLVTRTFEDIALQPLYTRLDLKDLRDLAAAPGEAPFLRGAHPTEGRRPWEAAQELPLSDCTEYNRALLANLQQGQDAVVLYPDGATRGQLAAAGVAMPRVGLPLRTVGHFATALAGVDLRAVPVHLEGGADPRALASLYLAYVERRDVPLAALRGSITGDPLGAAAESARFPESISEYFDAIAEWTRWAATNVPNIDTLAVNAALWGNAGATTTQELALSLACAAEYLRALLDRRLPLDVISGRIRFKFSIGGQFFTEVAKFRAFRPLWTRVLLAFDGTPRLAASASLSATTGRWNKTLLDPHVNMLRCTTEALSAVLGGCDALHVASFDELSGKTNEYSRRVALNVHTLLAEEFGFAATADPCGGSWYVETLTDQIGRSAWSLFQDIEKRGGYSACLKNGYLQSFVESSRSARASAVATRRVTLIGTTLFPNSKDKPLIVPAPSRSGPEWENPLPIVAAGPLLNVSDEWAFSCAIEAAARGTDVGQLALLFRKRGSDGIPLAEVKQVRAAEGFEAVRRAADGVATRTGSRPKVFLAKMGAVATNYTRQLWRMRW